MSISFLAFGSNLGNRRKNIRQARERLEQEGVIIQKMSRLRETDPVGGPPQNKYLNAVAKVKTHLSPQQLLKLTQSIEKELGRVRMVKDGPRTIDIDLLLYDNICIQTKTLEIPHPRMFERDFVMTPLKEVTPELLKSFDMKTLTTIRQIRTYVTACRAKGKTIGFVPTMGALHEGHLSLIRKCRKECDVVIVSIFVNPLQFGPKEDFKQYPRQKRQDTMMAINAGADIVFFPSDQEIYPKGSVVTVNVGDMGDRLCGKSRPGHFEGVATVVAKLFNIVEPHVAYFGQKDAQQVIIIKKFVEDLNFPVRIKSCPTVREKGGLALSSRNQYLTEDQHRQAAVLYQSLKTAKAKISGGTKNAKVIIRLIKDCVRRGTSGTIEYVECVDYRTLVPVQKITGTVLIALAVKFGKARLIDNIIVKT
ncbi:MAG: pantoate--beta-alanine ligase [Candidatus Omnitrophica bacterium]|nr:pantoate--beta-alanine ligase [Candidatus Omnitrophota bacterium]